MALSVVQPPTSAAEIGQLFGDIIRHDTACKPYIRPKFHPGHECHLRLLPWGEEVYGRGRSRCEGRPDAIGLANGTRC